MFLPDPTTTFYILLTTQAAHLLHHRLAKRHISFAEVASSALLLVPPSSELLPAWLLSSLHLAMSAVQVAGSIWIRRLSPDWIKPALLPVLAALLFPHPALGETSPEVQKDIVLGDVASQWRNDAGRCPLLLEPIERGQVSSDFGEIRRWGGRRSPHEGLDYAALSGTPILAAGPGEVVRMGQSRTYGRYVQILHPNGLSSFYAHLSRFSRTIDVGVFVQPKSLIGYVGKTGRVTGNSLHFEVRLDKQPLDPAIFLAASAVDAPSVAAADDACAVTMADEGG